jgi:hypothetical protein
MTPGPKVRTLSLQRRVTRKIASAAMQSMGANPSWSFRPRGQRVVAAIGRVHLGTHSPQVSEGKRFARRQA